MQASLGLDTLRFDPRFMRELPADPSTAPGARQVAGAAYARVLPTRVAGPRLVAHSREMAAALGIDAATVASQDFADVFAGNRIMKGSDPYATVYGGHQFGNWARQLGDGRAISLGEVLSPTDERWELQLKGSGPTPFSRGADGRAVLRSSVREFLCSEAMFHLGAPTTRALSLVTSGDEVPRDMFYDGNVKPEPGAIVCRAAPSFIRFGHFELPTSRGDEVLLRAWVKHTIHAHFSDLVEPGEDLNAALVLRFFEQVARSTAKMVAHWMRVGFVHGVMNTDNMSILGLTIDYGPYGWVDNFDPEWTPNTTDAQGRRYRFGAQPRVALWNLARLAEALIPLVDDVKQLEQSLQVYADTYEASSGAMQAAKLGFAAADPEVDALGAKWRELITDTETDMTIAYRDLARIEAADAPEMRLRKASAAFYGDVPAGHGEAVCAWFDDYFAMVDARGVEPAQRVATMDSANPRYVLRNYMAQLAIDAAEAGDPSVVRELLELVRRPYDASCGDARWYARRPEWARHKAGCSMLSCSS